MASGISFPDLLWDRPDGRHSLVQHEIAENVICQEYL
jgi:hypothetical protein